MCERVISLICDRVKCKRVICDRVVRKRVICKRAICERDICDRVIRKRVICERDICDRVTCEMDTFRQTRFDKHGSTYTTVREGAVGESEVSEMANPPTGTQN